MLRKRLHRLGDVPASDETPVKGRRTAAEAGWHESRYNICAWQPEVEGPIVANLYVGTMGHLSLLEYALFKSFDSLPESHPVIPHLAKRGLIVNFDERERLEAVRMRPEERQRQVRLTICPTMACNFACPYCFQVHRGGVMDESTQDDVAALADRLLAQSGADELSIVWYGGEPLLAPHVIERLTPLLEKACSKHGAGIRATVLTNGYLLNRETARMLASNRVKLVRVTVDGVGATHDATRRLASGGATFEHIMENLSVPLPFAVEVRMNEHAGNVGCAPELRARVEEIARTSGNRIAFAEAHVFDSESGNERGTMPVLLGPDELKRLSLTYAGMRLHGAYVRRCTAQGFFNACVDEKGRLYACSSLAHNPNRSFGDARTWDPADPVGTATAPENRDWFVRASLASDPECRECLWFPTCAGGCLRRRLEGRRECVPWRDDPEGFVLAQYARMGEKRRDAEVNPRRIGEIAAPVLSRWGVARAWVYGSFALGLAHAGSDVDMIVEMPPGVSLGYGIFDLRRELKEVLGRKVDLHLPPNERARKEYVRVLERQKVLVYESK